jgi:hypothetical protein
MVKDPGKITKLQGGVDKATRQSGTNKTPLAEDHKPKDHPKAEPPKSAPKKEK